MDEPEPPRQDPEQVTGLQQEVAKLQAALRAANGFRSLLLTAIAHDVRTPLTAIIGFTALLGRDDVADETRRSAGDRISKAAAILQARVDDLFEVASIDFEGLPREPFDLGDAIRAALQGADVTLTLPPDLATVMGDEASAVKVLQRVIDTCARLARDTTVAVTARNEGDVVCVEVAEERTTFSSDELETLFQRFLGLPGTPSAPESGVGLYVAVRLAEAQGGELLVVPGQDSGLSFVFSLPVAARFASADRLR